MRLTAAFIRLVRLPNLIFIIAAQCLFQFCIYRPLYKGSIPPEDGQRFIFLVLASVMIAAAGYIINDYFDINIDEINKPRRMVVDKIIHRRWAIAWHFIFNILGMLFTFFAFPLFSKWYLILANVICINLLWFYSTNFKKQLLVGNLVISLLTAWTILVVFFSKLELENALNPGHASQYKFFRMAVLYAGFAFMISMIRESVKDLEDLPGDEKYNCRTMPVVWGVNATKIFAAVWTVVLTGSLIVIIFYSLQLNWWALSLYCVLMIVCPLLFLMVRLRKATAVKEFHFLSSLAKFIMFTGILSILFFYYYL